MGILSALKLYRGGPESSRKFSNIEIDEIQEIRVLTNEVGAEVTINKKDGSSSIKSLYYQDRDLPVGAILEPDKCFVISKKYGPEFIHYEGMNFVPEWVVIESMPLSELYKASNIQKIEILPTEYGQSAFISFLSGKQRRLAVNRDSRPLANGEIVNIEDCTYVKMRKFHTRVFDSIIVK